MPGEAPGAEQRFGLGLLLLPVAPGLAVQRITLGQQRRHFLVRQAVPVAVARHGLVLEGRPAAEVEVDQAFPLLERPTLQRNPRAGVAAGAHLVHRFVELLHRVQPALQGIAHALGFARRQALLVGEELDQGAAILVLDLHAVHDLHPRDAHQPALRRLALVADATQRVVAFGGMAEHALGVEDGLAILRSGGLQHCAGHHGQGAGTQVVPESCRLQGQASTVLFLKSAPDEGLGAHLSVLEQVACHRPEKPFGTID
ncbi:hypothetical protein D9M69_497390 [compost metagenome]